MPFICNEHNLFFQGQCDSPFDLAALQKALKPTMFEKWLKAIQASEMEKVWFWQLTQSFLFVLSCSEICLCTLSVLKKLRGEGCVSDQTSGMPPKRLDWRGLRTAPSAPTRQSWTPLRKRTRFSSAGIRTAGKTVAGFAANPLTFHRQACHNAFSSFLNKVNLEPIMNEN